MTEFTLGPGSAPDVLWWGTEPVLACRLGDPTKPGTLSVFNRSGYLIDFPVYAGPGWPRLCLSAGRAYLGFNNGRDGIVLVNDTGQTSVLTGSTRGNQPVMFGAPDVYWQQDAPTYPIARRPITGGPIELVGTGAPTGLAYVACDGRIVTVDENRLSVPGMLDPVRSGDVIVGTCLGSAPVPFVAVQLGSDQIRMLWLGKDSQNPRCAVGPNGDTLIAAWGAQGVRVGLYTPHELRALPYASTP